MVLVLSGWLRESHADEKGVAESYIERDDCRCTCLFTSRLLLALRTELRPRKVAIPT